MPGSKSEELKQKVKESVWKYLGAMVLEFKGGVLAVSLGRVAFMALFAQSMWIWSEWSKPEDLPAGMLTVLLGLLAYITGGKVVDAVARRQ